MTAYEPGTVAMVRTNNGESRAVRRSGVWMFLDREGYAIDAFVTDVRPLVVINPEDREQVERLVEHMAQAKVWATIPTDVETLHAYRAEQMQAALREFASPTPTRPETVSAHDGCHDKGWEDVDGVRYCVNCGWSEFARVMRELP